MPREAPPRRPPSPKGIPCPVCGHGISWRVAKAERRAGGRLVRRRECRTCGTRVTTVERAVPPSPTHPGGSVCQKV